MEKFIIYRRVSTKTQGESGLGLEAQAAAIAKYIDSVGGSVVADFVDIMSGSSRTAKKRLNLWKALAMAKEESATVIVQKLDRLSRDAAFLLKVRNDDINLVIADRPGIGKLEFGLLAVIADEERETISARIRAALAAKKARGESLGSGNMDAVRAFADKERVRAANEFALKVYPKIKQIRSDGFNTYQKIGTALKYTGIKTARGNVEWSGAGVRNLIMRAERLLGV